MSLINKMLSDLESREVLLADKQDVMLDGLYSAYDVEIENKPDNRKYYYVLLTIAVLLFTVYASNEPGFPVIDKNDSGVSGSTSHQFIDLPPVNISAVADITDQRNLVGRKRVIYAHQSLRKCALVAVRHLIQRPLNQ